MEQGQVSESLSFEPRVAKRQRPPLPSWVKVLVPLVLSLVIVVVGIRAHDWWKHPTLLGGATTTATAQLRRARGSPGRST